MTFEEAYDKYSDEEYGHFDRVKNKLSTRKDLHAFILLDKLVPSENEGRDIVSAAEHDEFWLGIEVSDLNDAATEEQMIELIRCGVRYDSGADALAFFT